MGAKSAFGGFDFEGLWDDCEYSLKEYVEPAPSDELIASIEEELGGVRLPAAYVELARMHNGGLLKRNRYPMNERTGWADDHIAIAGLYAIGRTSNYSLCGKTGSQDARRLPLHSEATLLHRLAIATGMPEASGS